MTRARRGWLGGKRPELSAVDRAFVDHCEGCERCKSQPLNLCQTGIELYEVMADQYRPEAAP